MATLFIHIGFHRTGTTSIQNYLWANRDRLAEQGICYPAIALSGPTHARLANVFKKTAFRKALTKMRPWPGPEEEDPYRLNAEEDADTLYESLREVVTRQDHATTVISSECFLEWINPSQIARYVCSWGVDVKIIVYLRRQDVWIQSVFNQIIKDRFLRYRGKFADMPQHGQMNYKVILDSWAEAFGRENIIVRVYEPGQLKDNNSVDDFLAIIGAARRRHDTAGATLHDNTSLHKDIVSLLHGANVLPVSVTEHQLILEALLPLNKPLIKRDGQASYDMIDRAERMAIVRKYKSSNSAVAKEYLGRKNGVLFHQAP